MRTFQALFIIICITFSGFILLSCSSAPSDSEIKSAVKKSLEERVPVSLARHLTGGQDAIVEEVRIIEVGKKQGEGSYKYWPVKIYAKGTCLKMFGGRERFEGQAEYRIFEDEYGNLKARPKGF
ncbi:MAG: hypothetical protein KKA19_01965 [Candidatus Margulisbacteria bacterium]|nr:hypothetical protein [Candidatus Margulisiibacteriota bacterium]